jgi:hypothetical protein
MTKDGVLTTALATNEVRTMAGGLKAALTLALFIVLASAGVLLGQTPGTAEFVVSVMSLIVGLVFLALVIFVIKRLSR